MNVLRRRLCLLALCLLSSTVNAQLVPGDKAYITFKESAYQYVYSEDHVGQMPAVVEWNRWFLKQYQKSFEWEFDELATLIIASGQNQIANGYATVIPHLKTLFYPAGILMQDDFAVSSWFKVLMVHETAHLYQLNVKPPLPKLLKKIFGNALVIQTPIVVPIFIHPNVFLPTLLPEGNAVMNESRWNIGGRLFSGQVKALVYNQALEQSLDAERLLNDHLDFPFGQEKYYQGGYFFQYLAEKYGVDRVNMFFKFQADHFIVPLILNETFYRTFGAGYNQLFREYSRDLELKAKGQRQLAGEAFEQTEFFADLNQDENEIFFLAQRKGKSYPRLWQIKKNTSTFTAESKAMDLASGKVFKTPQGWASVSSQRETSDSIKYGLFLEGLKPYDKYWGWALTDARAGHSLSFEPTQSFFQGQLYKDGEFLSVADSAALLDNKGRAYYFIQNGPLRELYRDNEKLFEYQGYYGKLMEIDDDEGVYFVAGTDKGSGLFYWPNSNINSSVNGEANAQTQPETTTSPQSDNRLEAGFLEILPSDRIVAARRLNKEEFIAVEIGAEGYQYKIAKAEPRQSTPYFQPNPLSQEVEFGEVEFREQSPEEIATQLEKESKTYHYLTQLRYNSLDYYYQTDDDGFFMGGVFLNFSDPLEWNAVNLAYMRDSNLRDNALFTYTNTRHRLGYQLNYLYEEDVYYLYSGGNRRRLKAPTNSAIVNLAFPLFFEGRWSAEWRGQLRWDKEDRPFIKPEDRLAAKNALGLDWSISYPLAYDTFRAFNFTLAHQLETTRQPMAKVDDIYSVSTSGNYDLGRETYFNARYDAAFSQDHNVSLDNALLPASVSEDYYGRGVDFEYRMNQIQIWEARLKKAVNTSYYFSRFPLSLRRWAPFIAARHYETKDSYALLKRAFWEYEFGAEVELLLAHKIPLRTAFSAFESDPTAFGAHIYGWSLSIGTVKDF